MQLIAFCPPKVHPQHSAVSGNAALDQRGVPQTCPLDGVLECRISASKMTSYGGMEYTHSEILNAIVAGQDEAELRDRLHQVEVWFHESCDG